MAAVIFILIGIILALLGLSLLARFFGFQSQKPADYGDDELTFDIRERLNGPLLCDGVIYGPLGKVTSRFTAEIEARWDDDTCVMSERFEYDSGRRQDREWRLAVTEDGQIRAEADDVLGAGSGRQDGSAVQLNYCIKLPDDAGGHALDVTDWMYLTPNGVIMNRSQFRKFGIKVAELVATMRPAEQQMLKAAE